MGSLDAKVSICSKSNLTFLKMKLFLFSALAFLSIFAQQDDSLDADLQVVVHDAAEMPFGNSHYSAAVFNDLAVDW